MPTLSASLELISKQGLSPSTTLNLNREILDRINCFCDRNDNCSIGPATTITNTLEVSGWVCVCGPQAVMICVSDTDKECLYSTHIFMLLLLKTFSFKYFYIFTQLLAWISVKDYSIILQWQNPSKSLSLSSSFTLHLRLSTDLLSYI